MSLPDHILRKLTGGADLERRLAYWRFKEKRIVFTNGCFDILHAGHITYLMEARRLGHVLVVGLNSDDSVKRLKGEERPLNDEQARGMALAALSCVDAVVTFREDTPLELLHVVKPQVLVKGGDYKAEEVVGYELLKSYGGEVVILPFVPGFSTTGLIGKIRKNG